MDKGTLRQLLLITDGQSNRGESPVQAAEMAYEHGITVNVIGVLDEERDKSDSLAEVEQIAKAGGGISQVVYKENLSQTVQAVTRQAMSQTLQGFVNKELSTIFKAEKTLEQIEPDKRGEVMEVVEEVSETCNLEVLILVDTSASMNDKLLAVKEALLDLSINLQARVGDNTFSIYQFPSRDETIQLVQDWTPTLNSISSIFPELVSGGITPTGPAIREAIYQFSKQFSRAVPLEEDEYADEG